MTLLHYIDNEVPAYGEWDSVVENGSSAIVQSADAAFPERPSTGSGLGLRITAVAGATAYAQKNLSVSVAAGGDFYVGFWFNVSVAPNTTANPYALFNTPGNSWAALFYYYGSENIAIYARNDAGGSSSQTYVDAIVTGRWYWVVIRTHRASSNVAGDGYVSAYVDGVLLCSTATVDNYDIMSAPHNFTVGGRFYAQGSYSAAQDEIKIATTYPEPFVPTPLTEYPEARRTVVLFRQASGDSREFADYCVEQLDVPRCNLCPLPNATANESLADYATFQTEVETDLAAWLALNPTVAANCSCFLIGHGMPGYFTSGGVKHSATSRLMNYGTAFSSQTDNPLYNPATVARLTKTALGGKYLCTRIDADTLQHAKDVLDCGLQIADCGFLPATDKLYSDDSDYRASLACQHLRIIAEGLPVSYRCDAFVWGDTGAPSFHEESGSRAVFADDSVDSADTLRATSELFDAIVTNGYAAGLGFSATPSTLCPTPFFEMLRIGGTLSEAFAVAISKLDYTAVAVGSPLMTVAFGLGGYNVYRGLGGIEGIDWENPIAYLMPGQDSITLAQDMSPGQRYVYAVRSVSSAGIEEHNTHVIAYAKADEQGILLPAPLARPKDPTVEVQQSALLIGFSYLAPIGFAQADGFDILSDNGTGQLDLENPVATIEISQNDRFDFEVSIARPDTPVLLAVRARQGEQVGPISEIMFVPLVSAPASIHIL